MKITVWWKKPKTSYTTYNSIFAFNSAEFPIWFAISQSSASSLVKCNIFWKSLTSDFVDNWMLDKSNFNVYMHVESLQQNDLFISHGSWINLGTLAGAEDSRDCLLGMPRELWL